MGGKNEAFLLVIATLIGICSAATYTVGGNTGWTIPSQSNFYSNWASQQTFQIGDVLVFNFPAGAHTVGQVNKANFDACGTSNTIGQIQTTSPATITLTTAGTHYFICTLPGHCGANQKLSVVVTGTSATTPAPAPAPARKVISPVSAPTTPASAPTPVSGVSTPVAAPTPSIEAPSPFRGAPTPATAPTPFSEAPTPTSGALTPSTAPTPFGGAPTPTGGAPTPTSEATGSPPVPETVPLSPSGSPTTPAPSSPTGNSASSTCVSLLSLVSVAMIATFIMY
ncbi:unnamed protein product [Amaranthus hypochondriacus]